MVCSSFVPSYFYILFYSLFCLCFLRNNCGAQGEEHDDFAVMSKHDFADLDICEEPPPPMNGELHCAKHKKRKDRYVCKADCNPGFQFPNGKQKGRHMCDLSTGKWNPAFTFPDCIHICNPPCENGGQCSDGNHCICTPEYRGDRCQYSIASCDAEKYYHSSGGWSCNHTATQTRCILNCPQGTKFETQPADAYDCDLNGLWSPSFAPKCVPINIIEPPAPQTFYSISYGHKSNRPTSGVCATWGAIHYRTFDGGLYSFQGPCSYLFAKDCEQNTFSIHVRNAQPCETASSCLTSVIIYIGTEEYILTNDEIGSSVSNGGQTYVIPTALNGLLFEMLSDYVTVKSSIGFRLKWNRKNTVLLKISSQLMNRTCGLCGKFDGSVLNDFESSDGSLTDNVEGFVNSWSMQHIGEKCEHLAVVKDPCSENKDKVQEAEKQCQVLFSDKFSSCHQFVDPKAYFEACRMDYCGCTFAGNSCFCNSLSEYFRECTRLGGKVEGGWRSDQLCPLACPEGMVYNDCGTSCPQTCKGTIYDCEDDHCVDGCHCPEDTVLHNGRCIEKKECPCLHNGIEHRPGERFLQECNACECNSGKWECTNEQCDARCSSTGDPHYTTFDGLNYEFLGSCSYYLVFHENFTIVQETGPCETSNSETDSMFCTHGIRIEKEGESLLLQSGIKAIFNDKEVDLPILTSGFSVSMATDTFLKASLKEGVSLLWDGRNRIYIDASPAIYDQTMGLCGTFNKNQNDDFLTPERDVEADVAAFAARWQSSDSCNKRLRRSQMSPCEANPQKLSDAETLCSIIDSDIFKECHNEVEPYSFYKGCVNDLCMCGEKLENCLCPVISDYSMACTKKGIIINWMDQIAGCKHECDSGLVYSECGNPCTCSCAAITSGETCKAECVQGCICSEGTAMNNEGICVTIDQCYSSCNYDGKKYADAEKTLQDSKLCTCLNAKWQCRPATHEELVEMNPNMMINDASCLDEYNEEFTDCVDTCPQTCQNKHLLARCNPGECAPGCRCKDGYIFDEDIKKCVEVRECGCIHASQKFNEGEAIHQDCNLCTCHDGVWECTEKVCPGVCTAWGESHFKSFDGKIFDFQGECEYIMSKGKMKGSSFFLSIQNVPCGTSGVTCSKSFTLELGTLTTDRGDMNEVIADEEKITITRDEDIPKTTFSPRFVVIESGLFVLVYTDVGVTVRWDRGTRIYVTLDPKWRNRVQGLCGNFNDDQLDDFCTPSGGLTEVRVDIFADSWKVHEFCTKPHVIEDTCAIHPQRKSWAQQKCGILKSDVFAPCRAVVSMEPFYERCVFDSCACDMGGDCDCLCTAIAAYAQECSMHNAPVKWRSQELCPIQCIECATYDSCIQPCPKKTCENEFKLQKIHTSCTSDFCVEGCNPKPCPEGQIYNNEKEYKCIPKVDCVIPCLEINGILYNEGERINDAEIADPCQSCHCQRGAISCVGNPCVKTQPIKECVESGWTPWMNTPSFVGGDYEKLSDPVLKSSYENYCGVSNMTGLECRAAKTKVPLAETGQTVLCELPHGLLCLDSNQKRAICEDYEIRVFCDCGPPPLIETIPPTTPTPIPTLPAVCDNTGWTPWMSSHLPNEDGEFETLNRLRANHYFCAEEQIENVECRSTISWRYASEDKEEIICNKNVGLICKGPHCHDYEVRVFCNCMKEETTPAKPSCVTGWTEYFNIDHPDRSDTGDDESLGTIREKYDFCIGGTLEDIECKTLKNGELVDYTSLDTFGLKCSKNVGFICNKYVRADPCPDFMVRFYCACEEIPVTTYKPTTLPVTTTQEPVTHVPVECGWTPWLNIDTPDINYNEGDIEDLSVIQMLYKTCGGKDLVDIECRMSRTLHNFKESLQNNLVCDTVHGFRCKNEDQVGNCYDYEIRLLCMYDWCYPPTTTPIPTTKQPTTTENPCPFGQVYDKCAYDCSQMCSSFLLELSEKCNSAVGGCIEGCRPAEDCESSKVWRDYHTCVLKEECTCAIHENDDVTILAPNEVVLRDCEKCQCVHDNLHCYTIPGCGITEQPAVPRIIAENILKEDCWTEWINMDEPFTGGGDLEVISKVRQYFEFCNNPVKIECRTSSSKQKPFDVGQVVVCDLETGLVCWNNDNKPEECYDYEIRFFCPCPTTLMPTTISTTPVPTLQPGACVYGWTEWFNNHYPDTRGDFESIQNSRTKHIFCSNEMISAIECRRVGSTEMGSLQRSVHCDLHTGLVCIQENLNENDECWDYEVRFFCDCPTIAPITETVPLPPTTTKLPVHVSCAYWSEWINEHHPVGTNGGGSIKKGVKGGGGNKGDTEKAMLLKLQREYSFCLEGYLSDIECREASTDVDYTESGDNKLVCSLYGGFRCRGKDQDSRICKDYKIRYFCSCEETPTTTVLTKPTTTFIHVVPCSVYYDVIDGPAPLPDSSIKASSSKNTDSGPQSARLSSSAGFKSAGAWVAGDLNEQQFIEVDLQKIQPVYGVVTKGRHGHQEWVTSYKVMYSRDGMAYAYVADNHNLDKIFNGNFDGDTPVEHIFRHPFEARFIRIQPISFHKEIAMRFDVLGCAEGMTTVPTTTVTPPPCVDEMGMSNGEIREYQIKTSSNKNENTDGRYVRLNTPQTEYHSGSWVAEHLDQNQFVEVDFIESRVLTGVKIQGRDMVPQWVTAFTVSYSLDSISWNKILDSNNEIKVFSGNYDSNTVVVVYFSQPIRASFIRIQPFAWENWIAMRLEILGCFEPLNEVKDEIATTSEPLFLHETCTEKMGFENHQLPDTLITVSSSAGPGSDVSRIRLNTRTEEHATGGWVPDISDYKPVVFIDFYGPRNLSAIITQGLEDADKWVMSYYVKYSLDNITWESIREREYGDLVFGGNSDRNSEVLRMFSHMIEARYLKIIIIDYHTGPALRMEVLGCFIPYPEVTLPPLILVTATEICVEYGPWMSFSDPASDPFGDVEPIAKIISASGMCSYPFDIQCRSLVTQKDYSETGQLVTCDLEKGLKCRNQDQSSYKCYNYEVRIKCWTCNEETTTPTPRPLELCPEVPESMKNQCPTSCPMDYACDGYDCVPHMNCPCYREEKKFKPSNILVTSDCNKCECILGGYSNCRPIECPACLPGQKSEINEHCDCKCVGCPFGTVLCPTSGECVDESKWCDGIVDCPDDEAKCPTTAPPTTTTTLAPTTTELPIICSTNSLADTDTCEMVSNLFETFDGLTYQYDICDHVLMRESSAHLYSVTVHKSCNPENPHYCQRYLIIDVDGVTLKIGPAVDDITVQDNRIPVGSLWLVSQRFQDFSLMKKGNAIIFSSKKYHFDVTWDVSQDARITVSKCLIYKVLGMCGFYNKDPSDDRTLPIGKLTNSNEDFGNSWGIGPPERCIPPKCPIEFMKTAIELCSVLKEDPFNSSCSNYIKMDNRIEACIVFMCDCLQMTSLDARSRPSKEVFYDIYDSSSCSCLAYDSFVEACETSKREPVPEWRIKYGCTPECPPEMEWQECGPGCELSCDNYHDRDSICTGGCTPGCYCPSGLIRHHNRCVKPKMCQDCVCRGHGDPNYITFDGRYYSFQGNCTYILAQHLTSPDPYLNFRILATNVECPEEPHTSCTEGIKIEWNGHTIEKFKNKPVYFDDMALKPEDSPLNNEGISITIVPGKSTIIHIKQINLAVRYFDQMYGFNIELPAFYYFNKTEGLCGVCNFIKSDDIYHKNGYVTEDIEDFAYSWLEEHEHREHCELPRVVVPEPPPGICNFTISPCEVFLDPELYSRSCQNDITYSHKPEASMCRSKFQYAQQCCERGISLIEWLKLSGCENTCPEGMTYECTSACPKTCDNYKNYHEDDCDLMPLYTCKCPGSQVLNLGKCVDFITCETCDALGHIIGDVWNVGHCETCKCMSDLSTKCTVIQCPGPPICKEHETLEKFERQTNSCCDSYHCVEIAQLLCPALELQDCREGESNVVHHQEGCPMYECKCMPELCPPFLSPFLEEGEDITIETEYCCPHYQTQCYSELCGQPPQCGPGFKLTTYEGKCCLKYSCVPKHNVCVYQYKYDVLNGTQIDLAPEEYHDVEYEAGSNWHDGLCRKCACVEIEGQYTYSCKEEMCPELSDFPDFEKYAREAIHIPGACCPKYRRVACKSEGNMYQIGEEWPSPDGDNCKKFSCVEDPKREAAIMEKNTICHKICPDYAVYVEPLPESGKCCGDCKPVACEENGLLYDDGQTWMSITQPCYKAICTVRENGTHISYKGESCPPMPENCPPENVKTDPKGCCTYCKITTDKCSAVQIPLYETRGYFGYVDNLKGFCTNEESLEDLTKCAGRCNSESLYSNLIGDFQSVCNCCLPQKTKTRTVTLYCEDGSKLEKIYQQPLSCQCSSCSSESEKYHEDMNKMKPY